MARLVVSQWLDVGEPLSETNQRETNYLYCCLVAFAVGYLKSLIFVVVCLSLSFSFVKSWFTIVVDWKRLIQKNLIFGSIVNAFSQVH